MRKDIEEEMPADLGYVPDSDLSDEELLGEATLAKLQAQRADEEEDDVEDIEVDGDGEDIEFEDDDEDEDEDED